MRLDFPLHYLIPIIQYQILFKRVSPNEVKYYANLQMYSNDANNANGTQFLILLFVLFVDSSRSRFWLFAKIHYGIHIHSSHSYELVDLNRMAR